MSYQYPNDLPWRIDGYDTDYHATDVSGVWVDGRHVDKPTAFDIDRRTVSYIVPGSIEGGNYATDTARGRIWVEFTIKGKRYTLAAETRYCDANPDVAYTLNDRGLKTITHDDDWVHFILSTGGRK